MALAQDVDFGKTARDYAKHRAGFPPELLLRLKSYGVGLPGQDILDIGTGTGTLARQLAIAGAKVIGIDMAEPLLQEARNLAQEVGAVVTYRVGKAEDIPLDDESQDVVTAGQCWHWFDPVMAGTEVRRVLRDTGTVVVCHFDWLPLPGNVVEMTERLILEFNPTWHMASGSGLYPRWLADLATAGFGGLETFSFDMNIPYSLDDWCGRIRASAGVAASLPTDDVSRFDADHRTALAQFFPQDPLSIPHRVWAVVGRKSS